MLHKWYFTRFGHDYCIDIRKIIITFYELIRTSKLATVVIFFQRFFFEQKKRDWFLGENKEIQRSQHMMIEQEKYNNICSFVDCKGPNTAWTWVLIFVA